MATDLSMELELQPLDGDPRPLADWLTMFHLGIVALDPYTNESSWILPTAKRILDGLRGSDIRVAFLVTADAADTRQFCGPLVDEFLVFTDPDRLAIKEFDLQSLPAFVFVRADGALAGAAEGWIPAEWDTVAEAMSEATAWIPPDIPADGDPGPFRGSPAAG